MYVNVNMNAWYGVSKTNLLVEQMFEVLLSESYTKEGEWHSDRAFESIIMLHDCFSWFKLCNDILKINAAKQYENLVNSWAADLEGSSNSSGTGEI